MRFRTLLPPLLLAALACGGSDIETPREPHPKRPIEEPAPEVPASAILAAEIPTASPIGADTRQLLVGVSGGWDDIALTLRRYERGPGGAWTPVGDGWPSVAGRTGLAWGIGLHGDGAPEGRSGPVKAEGDKRSPAGVFEIGGITGYDPAGSAGYRMPYTEATADLVCVDDGASSRYNRVASISEGKDWSSSEKMLRSDDLYRRTVWVGHNPKSVPGKGSCVLLHLWRRSDSPTLGCTAMAPDPMEALLGWLDPQAKPAYVLMPAPEYDALAPAWGLPTR